MSWSNTRNSMIGGLTFWVRCRTTAMMLGTQPSNPDLHRDFIASKNPDHTSLQFVEELKANEMAVANLKGDEEDKELQMTIFPVARFFVAENGRMYDPAYDIIPEGLEGEYKVLPFIYDYQARGSFKESISMLTRASGGKKKKDEDGATDASGVKAPHYNCADITNYKKVVDGTWFVINRKIPLEIPETWVNDLGDEFPSFVDGKLNTYSRPLRAETARGPRTALATSEFVPAGTEFFYGIRLLNPKDLKSCLETLDYKAVMGMLQWRGGGKGTLIWTLCNKEGIPYDDLTVDELTDQDKEIIKLCNKIVPGIAQPKGYEIPNDPDPTPADGEAPKKRTRKKKAETDAEAEATEKAPKKRGRKKVEPTVEGDNAEAAPKKRGRKKAESAEVAPDEGPKKRGRRKKVDAAEAETVNA